MGYWGKGPRLGQPERSRVVPGKWAVYDYGLGQIAKRDDGTLAYFDSRAEAKRWRDETIRREGYH